MTKPNDEPTGYEEIVEKVLAKQKATSQDDFGYCEGFNDARDKVAEALTSGLLCDGRELAEIKEEYNRLNLQALKQLSGSCEGMTVERLERVVFRYFEKVKLVKDISAYDLAKDIHTFIHAQMTGGKK